MNRYTRYSCGLVLLLLLLSVGKVAGRVFATNTSITFSSTFVSVEALDAMTLTTISWTRQGHVAVYFDRLATDSLRFSTAENETALRYAGLRQKVPVVPAYCCADRISLNKKSSAHAVIGKHLHMGVHQSSARLFCVDIMFLPSPDFQRMVGMFSRVSNSGTQVLLFPCDGCTLRRVMAVTGKSLRNAHENIFFLPVLSYLPVSLG